MELFQDEDMLMLSGIQHIAFCERQFALAYIELQWTENLLTTEGHHLHERVDDPEESDKRGNIITYRAFPLISRKLGLTGRADVVELQYSEEKGVAIEGQKGKWILHPVEYKRGKTKPDDRDAVQVCAQAMCLEEMFDTEIQQGSLFYAETRRRVILEFTPELRQRVNELAEKMHQLFDSGKTPPPVYKPHCKACSLIHICLPKSMSGPRKASDYLRTELETD